MVLLIQGSGFSKTFVSKTLQFHYRVFILSSFSQPKFAIIKKPGPERYLEYFLHNDRSQTFSREFIRNLKRPTLVVTTITKPIKPVNMEKITSILAKKEPHFHTVTPGSSADTALSRMCHENVDYLIVMDDGKYVGLLTEHDIASKVVITNRQLTKTKVSDIMNRGLPAATTDDTVETCMQLMRQHHVRYLPVFEIHSFRGIVSSEDILEEAVNNRMEIFDAVVRRDSRFGVLT